MLECHFLVTLTNWATHSRQWGTWRDAGKLT